MKLKHIPDEEARWMEPCFLCRLVQRLLAKVLLRNTHRLTTSMKDSPSLIDWGGSVISPSVSGAPARSSLLGRAVLQKRFRRKESLLVDTSRGVKHIIYCLSILGSPAPAWASDDHGQNKFKRLLKKSAHQRGWSKVSDDLRTGRKYQRLFGSRRRD